MSDTNQQTLPGYQPMETKIVGPKMIEVLFETGIQIGLKKTLEDLKEAKAQHPAAVGLTMAIALVERDIANAQIKTTRIVLAAAAKAGLPIDGHAITSGMGDDCIVVNAVPGEPA